jgi:DNA-directed RNA polymerase subunit RPC12/RpoP
MYGDEWQNYICSKCEGSMPQIVNGEDVADWFNYCPFCGKKIRAFYETKEDAESLLTAFELQEYT